MLGALAMLLGVAVIAGWLVLYRDWRRSIDWPRVEATVRHVSVEETKGSLPDKLKFDLNGFTPRIRYSYSVEGQTYAGQRLSAVREPFFAEREDAEAFAARFPQSGRFQLYVDPENPRTAFAERRLTWPDLAPLGAAGVLTIYGAIAIVPS